MDERVYEVEIPGYTNPDASTDDDICEVEISEYTHPDVKILMVKGEKGEKGEKGDPGDPADLDYTNLENKPQINDVTLEGNKTFEDIGAESLTNIEIDNIINSIV